MPVTDNHSLETCFVAMPFDAVFDDYYRRIYAPAVREAGLAPERADNVLRAGSILQNIVDLLSRATVVLVDISEPNRNVHYELGIAHALGKPTLLVAPEGMPLFFDVGQERMIRYDKNNAFWGQELHDTLVKSLRDTIANPESAVPTAFIHMKPSRVESDETTLRLRRVEESLAELLGRLRPMMLPDIKSGFAEKLHSPLTAQEEAARLLQTLTPAETIRQLMNQGYRQAMAEDAVYKATKGSFTGT